ncbi:proteoglycan 4 [Drosophila biarmipes]|uniref:proteoglycan 4 n=1 Tax=Drosophila biarmipes TaxID=125945 RepID=UPI0007E80D43|nr:proteoglycan 4 [Drosophila biarmipes]
MMQKCSDLGTKAWQHFVRFGQNNLKVRKGPDGHYLESRCREELQKSLPAESFEELMAWVAKWLKRLDEKNAMVRQQELSPQDPKDKVSDKDLPAGKQGDKKTSADPAVVDLCSDGEDGESVGRFPDGEALDSESVISSSSLVILDDELGEVNLKDYADHVDGKIDEASLRKRNRGEEAKTPCKATKQTSMKAFLTPNKKKIEKSPSPVFRHSLKKYIKRSKIPASKEAKDVPASNEKRSALILRELNLEGGNNLNLKGGNHLDLEGGNNLNISSKEEAIPDVVVIDDLSQEDSANKKEKCEPPNEKTKPKTLAHYDIKEKQPTDKDQNQNDIKNEKIKPNDLTTNEIPPCDSSISKEIKSKSESDVSKVALKCDAKELLGTSEVAKENSEPNTHKEGPNLTITKDDSFKNEPMPVQAEMLLADPQENQEQTLHSSIHAEVQPDPPLNTIRIRSDLVACPMDTIRVRTDLLQNHVDRVQPEDTLNQLRDHVDQTSPAQHSNPPGAAEKRKLLPETAGNQCDSTPTSFHGLAKRPAVDNHNPTVNTSRYPHPPKIVGPPAPAYASRYQLIAPAPAIASSSANVRYPSGATVATSSTPSYPSQVSVSRCQPVIPSAPHTSNYQLNGARAGNPASIPVNAAAINNSSYPAAQGSATNSRYPQEIPVSAGNVTNRSYPPFMPVAPVLANSVWYPPPRYPSSNSVAVSLATTSFQPVCPAAPTASTNYRGSNSVPHTMPTASVYKPVMSAVPGSIASSMYRSSNPVAPAAAASSSFPVTPAPGSVETSRYPPHNAMAPAPVVASSYQPVKPAAPGSVLTYRYPPPPPVMSAAPGSTRYPPPNPVAPAAVVSSSYQPVSSVASGSVALSRYPPPYHVAPAAVVTSNYQKTKPAAPAPVASSSYQPNNPVAPAPHCASNNQLTGCPTNLSNIMGMLAQVEFFAYSQKNQEAFHLVNQLRVSLQKGAANNGHAA